MSTLDFLHQEIRACRHCVDLPLGPNPVVSFSAQSRILIIGQAPGTVVHATGVPWDDKSGSNLREWLGVTDDTFYDTAYFGIVPMGFCYPGKGKSGDLPPRKECAPLWHDRIRQQIPDVKLTLLIGKYAQDYYLKKEMKRNLTETVRHYAEYLPEYFVLPHPSPRNNIWLKRNDWFLKEVIPSLKEVVSQVIKD